MSKLDSVINSNLSTTGGWGMGMYSSKVASKYRTQLKQDLDNMMQGEKGIIALLKQRDPNVTEDIAIDRLIKLSSKKGTANYNPKLIKALEFYKTLI